MTTIPGRGLALFAAAAMAPLSIAHADPVPPAVEQMIEAAAASGDAATLKAVVDTAKKTNPNSAKEIDDQVAALNAKAEEARIDKLKHEKWYQGIKGEGQIALTNSTGNSESTSFAAGLNLGKETLHWKNTLTFTADYQKDSGKVSTERYLAGYEGNYKFTPRFYAVGTVVWDRNTFAGYSERYAGSIGLGYKVIDQPTLSLSLEAGPAIRDTDYLATPTTDAHTTTDFTGRFAGAFSWTITPNTVFTENVTTLAGGGDTTLISNTAITAKLIGRLSTRLNYLVQYESNPPPGIRTTDTTTRLALVYGF